MLGWSKLTQLTAHSLAHSPKIVAFVALIQMTKNKKCNVFFFKSLKIEHTIEYYYIIYITISTFLIAHGGYSCNASIAIIVI